MAASRTLDGLIIERVTDWSAFESLRDEWNRLASACAHPSVFLRHEWFDAAWQWAGRETSLYVLCARRGEALVGAMPLVLSHRPVNSVRRRVLEFLTVPDTQLCDLLARPGDESAVCRAFLSALGESAAAWDMLELRYLPAGGLFVRGLGEDLRAKRFPIAIEPAGKNPYIDLGEPWETYYSNRTRSLKKANNLAANRLKKSGAVEVVWYKPGEMRSDATDSLVAILTDISSRSWKRETGNSLDRPGPQAFIRRLSQLAADRGWLSVWTLSLDGKPLAMEYQLVFDGSVHALRADFDASYGEISPGSHLYRQLLEQLFGENLGRYFMGPGDNTYKQRWTEKAEELRCCVAYSRTTRGRFGAFVDLTLAPIVRSVRAKLRPAEPNSTTAAEAEAPVK